MLLWRGDAGRLHQQVRQMGNYVFPLCRTDPLQFERVKRHVYLMRY